MHWPLGRVIKVHPGADGIVRTTSIVDRGVKRLVPLPVQPDPDDSGQPHGTKEVDKIRTCLHSQNIIGTLSKEGGYYAA
jgi:hypothetical protein